MHVKQLVLCPSHSMYSVNTINMIIYLTDYITLPDKIGQDS